MTKKLALFDIDNTIYNGHVVTDLPEYLEKKGLISNEHVLNQSIEMNKYRKGIISYEQLAENLLVEFSLSIKGLDLLKVKANTAEFFKFKGWGSFGDLFSKLKEKNYSIFTVSGEPEFVGEVLEEMHGLDGTLGSVFPVEENLFTGTTENLLNNSKQKGHAIQDLIKEFPQVGSLSFGDSTVDISMLESTEKAVCIDPSDDLRAIAVNKGWQIIQRTDLLKLVDEITV